MLDTHVLLWALDAPETLSKPLLDAMREGTPKVASVASLWEIAIEVASGKLNAPDDLPRLLVEAEFEILPVFVRHAWAIRSAPQVLKTADPFDRVLFAQAKVDGLTLATRDRAILASGVEVMKA